VRAELQKIIKLSDQLSEKLNPGTYGDYWEAASFRRHFKLLNPTLFELDAHEILTKVSKRSRAGLKTVEKLETKPGLGPQKGEAWKSAVKAISRDFKARKLPTEVGTSREDPTPFVRFISQWQDLLLPRAARRGLQGFSALGTDIKRARAK
jgi:hypothetical protein